MFQQPKSKSNIRPQLRYNHRPARAKQQSESSEFTGPRSNKSTPIKAVKIEDYSDDENCKDLSQKDYLDKTEETSFLRKLHEFMTKQKTPIPKSVWFSLKNGKF